MKILDFGKEFIQTNAKSYFFEKLTPYQARIEYLSKQTNKQDVQYPNVQLLPGLSCNNKPSNLQF